MSTATIGTGRMAMTTVSHVWAFCAPPWTSTTSGGPSPHTRPETTLPSSTSTLRRSTTTSAGAGSPYSLQFSCRSENSW